MSSIPKNFNDRLAGHAPGEAKHSGWLVQNTTDTASAIPAVREVSGNGHRAISREYSL
jgi:hypothetical protein